MTKRKKRPPQWRVAFLRALKRGRNVRHAAWTAGVDYTTAYNHRKRDARFAREWAEALDGTGSSGAKGAPLDPSTQLGTGFARDERTGEARDRGGAPAHPCPGEELIVRSSPRSGPQLVRAGAGRWSAKAEKVFLDELADHGNARAAAAAARFSTTAVYARRRNYPEFAAKWAAAKECGRERIDLYLIEAANRTLDPDAFEVRDDLPKVTIGEAIQILRLHHASDQGKLGARRSPARHEPPIEEVRDEVLRRLAALRRQREREGGAQ